MRMAAFGSVVVAVVVAACGGSTGAPVAVAQTAPVKSASACAPRLISALRMAELEVFRTVDVETKYRTYSRSEANENRLRPFLDEVFAEPGAGAGAYRVECHANACRIEVDYRAAPANWRSTLQRHQHPARPVGFAFVHGETFAITAETDADRELALGPISGVGCAALEKRLDVAEAALAKRRSLPERFALLPRSKHREQALKPRFDAFFGPSAPYDLECRGAICRVSADHAVKPLWTNHFQQQFAAKTMLVGSEHTTLFVMLEYWDDAESTGASWFDALLVRVRANAAATTACNHGANPGDLAFTISVGNPRRIVIETRGSLASSPAAACFRRLLDEAIEVTPFPVHADIELPKRPVRFFVHAR